MCFLEPAIGTGSFYSALRQVFPTDRIAKATGIESDPAFAEAALSLWGGTGLTVVEGDFTRQPPDRPYNLVLANPPYVRHHHLSRQDKERLKGLVADRFRINISGLAGLYCYFLLLGDAWLEDGGLAVWLIPSEFMDVNYGTAVKEYLTERVKLLHIHRFLPTDVQFCDALVTSAVVIFEKSVTPASHEVHMTLGGPLAAPQTGEILPLSRLRATAKWTSFPSNGTDAKIHSTTLGDLFTIQRGLATGANSFFILGGQEARRLGIPEEFLRPILPSSRYIRDSVIEADGEGYPRLGEPVGGHRLRPAGRGNPAAVPGVLGLPREG